MSYIKCASSYFKHDEKFHYLNELGKIYFVLGRMEIWTHCDFCIYHRIFGLKKEPEYFCWLFDVLPKQKIYQMKTLQVQLYIQQWFHDEQRAEFM